MRSKRRTKTVGSEEAHKVICISDRAGYRGSLSRALAAEPNLPKLTLVAAAASSPGSRLDRPPDCISTVAFRQPCPPRRGCVSSWSQERGETRQASLSAACRDTRGLHHYTWLRLQRIDGSATTRRGNAENRLCARYAMVRDCFPAQKLGSSHKRERNRRRQRTSRRNDDPIPLVTRARFTYWPLEARR